MKKALAFSAATQFIIKLINLLLVTQLARLLTPDEIGVYAIAAGIILISAELQNLGAAAYIIRHENLTLSIKKNCLGVSLIISYFIGTSILILAIPLEKFYEIDDLAALLFIASLNFYITPFQFIPIAIYKKNLEFKPIMIILLITSIFEFSTTLTLVHLEFSYFAIVLGAVSSNILKTTIIFAIMRKDFIFMPSFKNLKPIIRFGLYISSTGILNRLSLISGDLIIGKIWSTKETAFFSRGIGFVSFVKRTLSMGIQPVILPYFSEVKRQQKNLTESYLNSLNLFCSVLWPTFIVIFLLPEPIIKLFFGIQWGQSAKLVPLLSIWLILRSMHPFFTSFMTSIKKEHVCTIRELIHLLLIIFSVLIGLNLEEGLRSICKLIVVTGFVDFIVCCYLLKKHAQITYREYFSSLKLNILLSISIMVVILVMNQIVNFNSLTPLMFVLVLGSGGLFFWFLLIKVLKLPIFNEIKLIFHSASNKISIKLAK